MKKLQLFACVLIACINIRAQTVTPAVISSNGGYVSGNSGSIAWTIGEPISETYSKSANITTMGFHQTDLVLLDFIRENTQDLNSVVVFPNPVFNELNVNFNGMKEGVYSLRVTDAAGRTIIETEAIINSQASSITLPFATVAEGNYLMSVKGKQGITNIKINKVNNN